MRTMRQAFSALALLLPPAMALRLPAAAGGDVGRRALLGGSAAALGTAVSALHPLPAFADVLNRGVSDVTYSAATRKAAEALDDLPPKSKQAYLQYLPQFQLDGDFITFELIPLLSQPGRWDLIYKVTDVQTAGAGATSVSRLEREFITPMRQVALAFPPDLYGDEMQASITEFQRAMFKFSTLARKNAQIGNVAPPTAKEIKALEAAFEEGRLAFNSFITSVNAGVGASLLVTVPTVSQALKGEGYPRSKRLYTQLLKDAALCRNRGGEQLAGLWGNLMVYGTAPGVNPCGNSAEAYYSQAM